MWHCGHQTHSLSMFYISNSQCAEQQGSDSPGLVNFAQGPVRQERGFLGLAYIFKPHVEAHGTVVCMWEHMVCIATYCVRTSTIFTHI